MSEAQNRFKNYQLSSQYFRYVAGAIALIVAGLHLFHPKHGLERLLILTSVDPSLLVSHPRPVAFVLSAAAIVAGIYMVMFEIWKKPIYILGMLLMLTYLIGYFAWHYTGHGGFLPGREAYGHGASPLETVIAHIRGDAWARASKFFESILLLFLGVLYYRES